MTSLIAALAVAGAMGVSPAPVQNDAWTWTLYEGDGPLVLANEVPDTPRLRSTLECDPGSGVARLSLYDVQAPLGFATARSGQATAAVEVATARGARLQTALRTDHPVFAAFLASGKLNLAWSDGSRAIEVGRNALPRLRRFAELCSG